MTEKAPDKVDAWMPLWIGAYLADTMNLSRDSHGGYLLLLFAYWRNKGPLPDDDEDMCGITKATPAEWKKLRPRLAKFFTIDGGFWIHGRADEELVKAGQFKAAASAKGKAGAAARWGKGKGNAPANATGIAQALPEQSPTPSPPPYGDEPIGSPPAGDDPEPVFAATPTSAGLICRALKRKGFSSVSPSHPGLLALLTAGATEGEFLAFADQALTKNDPFAYLLTVVQSERVKAAQLVDQMHHGELPAAESAYAKSMRQKYEEVAPAIAARAPGAVRPNPMDVLDGLTRITG